ncbi:MAG: ComEC/Rec2 family competence protein, partial [Hyphomicrobium sp.]
SLSLEPGLAAALVPLVIATIVFASLPRGTLAASCAFAVLLAGLGFIAAKARVEMVRAPVLQKVLVGVRLTGRLERVEPKSPRGERLTIAVETLGDLAPGVRPQRVRVRTLKAIPPGVHLLKAGMRVTLTATLSPPAKPALPGGFDFARTAWFEGLGGVGYTFSGVEVLPDTGAPGWKQRFATAIESVRATLNARIKAALEGQSGAIAAALITGERGGISEATNADYKNSGLFHILSISGLHMVIMAGAVFFSVRLLLVMVPVLALSYDIKKWAALAGIAGALGYLAISGGAFATVRSAVMILVMFLAILLDRPALALRNVALGAFAILIVYPESLFDAGFQMSFAAVTGLIAAYEEVRRRVTNRAEPHPVLSVALFFGGIVLSTIIASVAVAPFAAYHFHQSQQYAVLANLLAIPICNFLVMPAALAALVLMPFGLEGLALVPMGFGIDMMSWCAGRVAKLPGAVGVLPAIPGISFVLLVMGGLWLALWQARWRMLGAALTAGGLVLAPTLPRPDALIARGGDLVAVRGGDGALSALPARQSKFELSRWLEHDGDARAASEAAKAAAFSCDSIGCTARVKGVLLAVARHPAAIGDDCAQAQVVVLNVPRPKTGCEGVGKVIDFFDIWRDGTHALYIAPATAEQAAGVRIETVAAHRGDRPWSQSPKRHLAKPRITPRERHAARNATSNTTLPAFARRPDWLAPAPPRPEIEDDEGEDQAEGEIGQTEPGPTESAPSESAPSESGPTETSPAGSGSSETGSSETGTTGTDIEPYQDTDRKSAAPVPDSNPAET